MKNRTEAVAITNEALSNLTPSTCLNILKEVNYNIATLIKRIYVTYPEIAGWYYDNECKQFCNEIIKNHIVTKGIETVTCNLV